MTPREMLRRYFSGSDYRCDDLMNSLHSAGYRILGPGEWDKETVEKCAEVVEPKGPRPCDCERHRHPRTERRPVVKLTQDERICFDRAMAQWWQSLSRPDLTDEDRVKGALYAYMRQQTALDLPLAAIRALAKEKQG